MMPNVRFNGNSYTMDDMRKLAHTEKVTNAEKAVKEAEEAQAAADKAAETAKKATEEARTKLTALLAVARDNVAQAEAAGAPAIEAPATEAAAPAADVTAIPPAAPAEGTAPQSMGEHLNQTSTS